MSLWTHARPIVLGLDAGMLARKQGRVLLRVSHKQRQGGQPKNGPMTKDRFNRPQQTPQQPWPGTPVDLRSLQNFSKFSTKGVGMPALCLI